MWSLLPDAACYSSIKITCEVSLPGATVSLMYAKMLSQVAERRVDCALVSSSTKFVRSDAGRRSSRGKYTLRTCNFMLFTILLICCFIHFTWINSNEQKSIFLIITIPSILQSMFFPWTCWTFLSSTTKEFERKYTSCIQKVTGWWTLHKKSQQKM